MKVQIYVYASGGRCIKYTELMVVDENFDPSDLFNSIKDEQWIYEPGMEDVPEVWVDILNEKFELITGTDLGGE